MRRLLTSTAVFMLAGVPIGAGPEVPATRPNTQLPGSVRPTHYDIAIAPDAGALTFSGKVGITIEVLEPATSITLNADRLSFSAAHLAGPGDPPSGRALKLQVDVAAQTVTCWFEQPLAPGSYRLTLEYTGTIGTQAVGFFAIDYDTADGPRRALYTKFEPAAARRFVPCWDEPAYRATFALQAVVPSGQMAVSNMPIESRTDLGDGRSAVRFVVSPRMSTYLLFFGTGDFERVGAVVDGTDIGVITRKGGASQTGFVLAASVAAMREYNDYFGIPYPLPKLDNIAAPGRSQAFSAMENWGAILSFEHALLLDPSISTEADRQRAFVVAAHEISHQWFGDLVTMRWWDDLWLSEGFASWMEGRTSELLHPEWSTALAAVGGRERAMARDALATSHPVVQHVETVEQAVHAFDSITYEKGEAVIRMLERYVGASAWREGVRRYLRAHAYGNTASDDLWREIEAAAGQPIMAIAHDFTLQPGVPLIHVGDGSCHAGRTSVSLTQGEFSPGRLDQKPLAWRVPVIVGVGAADPARALVGGGRSDLTSPGCGTLVVNVGQSGYYRTLYAPKLMDSIVAGFPAIASIDQLGIVADAWALGAAGYQPASDVLDLSRATPAGAESQVWGQFARVFTTLDDLYRGEPARQAAFRVFATTRLTPVFTRVGWTPAAGEPATVAILRSELIETLGVLGDPAVIAEARRRHAAETSDPAAIPAPLRKTILRVVARHADTATWDSLHAAAQAEKTPLVRDMLYSLLSAAEDETLARRALDLALTPEPGATQGAAMIRGVSEIHPDLAFDFALAHMAAVNQKVDASLRSRYYPALAAGSLDPAMIAKLATFAASLDARSRREADTAAARISHQINVRRDRLPLIDIWLAHDANTPKP